MKTFFELREGAVKSADKKPEKSVEPDGKTRIRMVPADKEIIKKSEDVDEGHGTTVPDKEETQLDELSKKVLGSYIKKASKNVSRLSYDHGFGVGRDGMKQGRNKKAVDKLTK